MPDAVVLFLHRDPVVHEIVAGALGDEFTVACARTHEEATELAARQQPAVLVADVDGGGDAIAKLVGELRARHPHLRAVFFADAREPVEAWRLADLGTVLAKTYDIERLRVAVRRAAHLWGLSSGAEKRARAVEDGTTKRLAKGGDGTATERISYFGRAAGDRESTPTTEPPPRKAKPG
jgi:DNA-binding NtrC family response regulator